jgi:ESCRT-II complex subunit VPS25
VLKNGNQNFMPKDFVFPEIYNFAPFFTQQPNLETWKKQRDLWASLIMKWMQFHKNSVLYIDTKDLFTNESISRTAVSF